MNPLLIGPLADLIKSIVGRIWPDPAKQAEATAALMEMQQKGELAELDANIRLATAQTDINKAEAASGNAYAAGWRPTIGYVCALALAFHYLVNPLMIWACVLTHAQINPPDIQLDSSLWQLMFGLLGLGAMRSYEKVKGATK